MKDVAANDQIVIDTLALIFHNNFRSNDCYLLLMDISVDFLFQNW